MNLAALVFVDGLNGNKFDGMPAGDKGQQHFRFNFKMRWLECVSFDHAPSLISRKPHWESGSQIPAARERRRLIH